MNVNLRLEYKDDTKDYGSLSEDDRKNRYLNWLEDELTNERQQSEVKNVSDEEMSYIIDLVNEQRDSCGMIAREDLIEAINEKLQKAKEEQPKDVEEFYKKWSSDCRILPKEHEAIHSHEDLLRFAKDFANSRKEVTDEEIYSHVNQYYEFDDNMNDYMSVYAEGAKWMRKQLNK